MRFLQNTLDLNGKLELGIHGGCVGADMEFHLLAKAWCDKVHVYPGHFANNPDNISFRGNYGDADFIKESETHFKRNRAIVNNSDVIIATPYDNNKKGGTWYTINYAKKKGKPVIILW